MPISKIKAGGINDDAVTTAKIVDGTVAAVDIADGAVTSAKLDTNIDIAGTLDVTGNTTLDSNVTIGTSDNFPGDGDTNTGIGLLSNGSAAFSRDGFRVVSMNRNTSDGTILEFNKDGTQVGSIGTRDTGALEIGSDDVYLQFNGNNDWIKPVDGSGNNKSGVDLGTSGARFDNLYLSGGVYLGGTGSANYLDDYEEGTFTPVIDIENGGTVSGTKYGHYVKVGNMVTVNFGVPVTGTSGATSGNALQFSNMPFASRNQNGSGHPLAIRIQSATVQTYHWMGQLFSNATNGRIEGSTNGQDLSNSSTYIGNGTDIKVTITYITN